MEGWLVIWGHVVCSSVPQVSMMHAVCMRQCTETLSHIHALPCMSVRKPRPHTQRFVLWILLLEYHAMCFECWQQCCLKAQYGPTSRTACFCLPPPPSPLHVLMCMGTRTSHGNHTLSEVEIYVTVPCIVPAISPCSLFCPGRVHWACCITVYVPRDLVHHS